MELRARFVQLLMAPHVKRAPSLDEILGRPPEKVDPEQAKQDYHDLLTEMGETPEPGR